MRLILSALSFVGALTEAYCLFLAKKSAFEVLAPVDCFAFHSAYALSTCSRVKGLVVDAPVKALAALETPRLQLPQNSSQKPSALQAKH